MTTQTTTEASKELAKPTAGALVTQYRESFTAVLPSHIDADAWIRISQSALKRGKQVAVPGNPRARMYELELAALNNPGVFLSAMLDAARLGLEPGTEEFYLTPRKEKGQLQILGIVGYQGYIELMYRAGAVQSVVAECVYTNDKFSYTPGRDVIPVHEIDWDSEDRGDLRLVYSYAPMKGGGYSKVVVLNRKNIEKIKSKSQGANGEYSPWQTNPDSMWLKSAVRQLRKWVPTSREYIREQLRAEREVAAEPLGGQFAPTIPQPAGAPIDVTDLPEASDANTDDYVDGDVIAEDPEEYLAAAESSS